MLRAAAWTGGLFGVAGGVVHFFPGQFTEPLVLLALGATLLLISGKRRAEPAGDESAETNPARTPATSRAR